MWLLNVDTYALEEFATSELPRYAILSHTWGKEEVSFRDMTQCPLDDIRPKAGFRKIELTCRQAKDNALKYAWVDTCCIDKSSSAELSEAINSMFQWYQSANICYAYVSDFEGVNVEDLSFYKSRWWQRGWTLQVGMSGLLCTISSLQNLATGTDSTQHCSLFQQTLGFIG